MVNHITQVAGDPNFDSISDIESLIYDDSTAVCAAPSFISLSTVTCFVGN